MGYLDGDVNTGYILTPSRKTHYSPSRYETVYAFPVRHRGLNNMAGLFGKEAPRLPLISVISLPISIARYNDQIMLQSYCGRVSAESSRVFT